MALLRLRGDLESAEMESRDEMNVINLNEVSEALTTVSKLAAQVII